MTAEIKLCECGCGNPAPIAKYTDGRRGTVKGQPLRFISGHNDNGCLKHGMSHTPECNAYISARHRCINPSKRDWKNYGGRGIKFLFTSFEQWYAELGPRPGPEYSVDRWPNKDGNYEPGNVRWATKKEQQNNRRPQQKAA